MHGNCRRSLARLLPPLVLLSLKVAWAGSTVSVSFTPGSIAAMAGTGTAGNSGNGQSAVAATLREPGDVAVDGFGNVYIADTENNAVRRIDAQTKVISEVAGTGMPGHSGDNGPAVSAALCAPRGLAVDNSQNVWIADSCNNVIRKVNTSGVISTLTLTGTGATLSDPTALFLDPSGTLYVADTGNNRVGRINTSSGAFTTIAGNGTAGYRNDGSVATSAELNQPQGIAVDGSGVIYIADTGNNVIRRVDPTTGNISTVAGGGTASGADTLGDGSAATGAVLDSPTALAIDPSGSLLISDTGDDVVRRIDGSTGIISIIAGIDPSRWETISAIEPPLSLVADASALDADILRPEGLAMTAGGLLYIADTGNDLIRSVNMNVPFLSFLTSSSATLSITNTTGAPLTISEPSISGAEASDFTVDSNSCSSESVAPGATCQLQVSFRGNSSGTEQATLSLTAAGVKLPLTTMEAHGAGGGDLVVSPALLTFTATTGKASSSFLVSITNDTGSAVSLGTPTLVGSGASAFMISDNPCPGELASGSSCSLSVLFLPQSAGSYSAGLSIPGGASTVQLSGTATGSQSNTTGLTTLGGQPLAFIPVQPCRVADTRSTKGAFGGPIVGAGDTRTFAIPQSNCNIPSSAAAYSLNVTAVPAKSLGYLAVWPAGQPKPNVSTLNSDGRVKANAVIVGAGTSGGVSVYASDASHVIVDIDGYFVASGTVSALDFFPVTPCRLVDTRGSAGSLAGPSMTAGETRSFPLLTGSCNLPVGAQAYSLNFTVVPHGAFGYLSVWPSGEPQPYVSTLNAYTGTVTSNAAIVPAGTNGDVSAFVTHDTDLIIDVNGYFADPATNGLKLYTMTPCRALDTRDKEASAPVGTMEVPVETGTCALPATAAAYVFNATVVPPNALGYLALWPDGESKPLVSTLNSYDAAITSNLAIVPVTNGSIDAYLSQSSHLILDISGYFAP